MRSVLVPLFYGESFICVIPTIFLNFNPNKSYIMPRASSLNDHEKGQIDALKKQGYNLRQIATEINRSITVVFNYLKLGDRHGTSPRSGRTQVLGERDKRRILKAANTGNFSCSQIKGRN